MRLIKETVHRKFIPVMTILGLGHSAATISDDALDTRTRSNVSLRISDFDNRREPLIQTLLRIAGRYNLPMGIEQVTPEALARPLLIRVKEGTLSGLLYASVRGLRHYGWEVRERTVFIYGQEELHNKANLFSLIVPSFELHDATIYDADAALQIRLISLVVGPLASLEVPVVSSDLDEKVVSPANGCTGQKRTQPPGCALWRRCMDQPYAT
jgi:hypothetical protein